MISFKHLLAPATQSVAYYSQYRILNPILHMWINDFPKTPVGSCHTIGSLLYIRYPHF